MSDNAFLYTCTAICLLLILYYFRYGRLAASIHLAVFLLYTVYGYYGLLVWSRGTGSSLLWFVYLLAALAVQSVILIVSMILRLYRARH